MKKIICRFCEECVVCDSSSSFDRCPNCGRDLYIISEYFGGVPRGKFFSVSLLVNSEDGVAKSRIKIRRLLEKISGVDGISAVSQLESGATTILLGECSEDEVAILQERAKGLGIHIESVEVQEL